MNPGSKDEVPKKTAPARPKGTTCMVCRERTARYYGSWANEGLCRPCVLDMEPEIRMKVIRDMHPADRLRWQADNKIALEPAESPAGSGGRNPVNR